MPKQVTKLKKKHRNHIWVDDEGDFWYWDCITEAWATLRCNHQGQGFYLSDDFSPDCSVWYKPVAAATFAWLR